MTLSRLVAHAALLLLALPVFQRAEAQATSAARRNSVVLRAPGAAAEEEAHPHHVAVLVGATTNLTADHTDPTVGIDYEYKPAAWRGKTGIAAFGELTFAEHTERILGAGLLFHPTGGLKLFAGAGAVFAEHEDPVTHEDATETSALLRMGAGWDFHFGRLTATPSMYYDVVKGHRAVVYGVALGRGF